MDSAPIERVMVTGATGFVGRSVVRELLARGVTPVCLVRSVEKLHRQHPDVPAKRIVPITGELADHGALYDAAEQCQAAIHLVGIIIARRLQGQSFQRVHVEGTRNVVDAVREGAVRRFIHMSALGTREDAVSEYHRSKWQAQQYVEASGLDWTVFHPSLIHGGDGEFMQLMKRFICGSLPPMIPYFGSGRAKVQPVSVKDVAYGLVEALFRADTIGKTIALGGPKAYSWVELYSACRALMPRAKHWKPLVSQPVPVAKLMAVVSALPMAMAEIAIPSMGLFRFDGGQVDMSQEDNTCDHTEAEALLGMRMRSFEDELVVYAERIP